MPISYLSNNAKDKMARICLVLKTYLYLHVPSMPLTASVSTSVRHFRCLTFNSPLRFGSQCHISFRFVSNYLHLNP